MKRKILSILLTLVLVLSFSLVTAVPAMAGLATNNPGYTFQQLTNESAPGARHPSFSPDGTRIVYATGLSDGSGQIWVMESDGTGKQRLDNGTGYECTPFWSSDGQCIIWSGGTADDASIMAVDVTIAGTSYTYSAPYVFFHKTPEEFATAGIPNVWVGDANNACNPAWFPGHDKIVFWVFFTDNQADLLAYEKSTDTLTRITDTPDYSDYEPKVSPDGTKIIYWSGETPAEQGPNVHEIPTTGWPITTSGTLIAEQASWPNYNRDGTLIGYSHHYGTGYTSNREIYVADATGEFKFNLTNLGDGHGDMGYVEEWGPDGEIVFASKMGGSAYNIWLATPRTTDYAYIDGVGYFSTIQAAIDASSPNDIIDVAAGTYPELVTIDKANVTIKSESQGAAIIKPSAEREEGPYGAVLITADDVTIDGFEVDGTTVNRNGINAYEANNVIIKNNIVHGAVNAWDGVGIMVWSWGSGTVDGALIENNEVYDTGRMGIIVLDHNGSSYEVTSNHIIRGNTVHDTWKVGWDDHGGSIQINVGKNSSIVDNVIYDVQNGERGIYMFGSTTGNTITGNTIRNNPIGIQLWISGEGGDPIAWGSDNPVSPQVNNNDIYDNDTGAISSNIEGTPMVMDATGNWWGNATGPKQATTNPNGLGNTVSDNVTYSPWLLVPKDDVGNETEVPEENFGQQSKEFTGTDTTVNTTGTTGSGTITVTTGIYSVPEDATKPLPSDVAGERALKYVDVQIASGSTYSGNVTITLSYTDADLAELGVKEDTLKLYYFKMTDGPWTEAGNQVLDTVNNTVSGDIPASELTGTPLCLGGEAEVTGQFEVSAAPSVTVTFTPTEMDPTVEQTVTVGVSVPAGESRTLEELTQVLFKVWYDSNGGTTTETEYDSAAANTQTCAVITWNGTTFSLDANAGDTTWSLGDCTAPTLTELSGNFTLKFTPGKVATETLGDGKWQIAATATSEYGTGFGYDAEATAMNWYGEMVLGAAVNVDWGSVPAGMDFDNAKAKQALGTTITYISNGDYAKKAKSSATWSGTGNTATLNGIGTPGGNEFSLKAYNADTLSSAVLLDTTGALTGTGNITGETGSGEASNYLWLKLGTPFSQDTYSGAITFIIQPGVI
ncbi:MAG: hypothetical protein PHN78_03180 [Dehalococcoidales bacterium]|nr:hypothetical protein [Dehalococcoidales bacterium]